MNLQPEQNAKIEGHVGRSTVLSRMQVRLCIITMAGRRFGRIPEVTADDEVP